jgi:hypothetical protein
MMPKAYMSERKQRKATVTAQNATVNGERVGQS